jgi:hypothetical protein
VAIVRDQTENFYNGSITNSETGAGKCRKAEEAVFLIRRGRMDEDDESWRVKRWGMDFVF